MLDLVVKNQTASGKNFDSLLLSVKDHFSVMKKTFNPKDYEVKVQFEGKYSIMFFLSCLQCYLRNDLQVGV